VKWFHQITKRAKSHDVREWQADLSEFASSGFPVNREILDFKILKISGKRELTLD
jgi:hypothetical protein